MPRGGARAGAGRKPQNRSGNVIAIDGRPRADVLPPSMQDRPAQPTGQATAAPAVASPPLPLHDHLLQPPADLSEEQQAIWRDWAPKAIAQGTLTDLTTPGFRELVQRSAIQNHLYRMWSLAPGSESVLKDLQKNNIHVDRLLIHFRLTGAGKPEPMKKKPIAGAAGGWAGFGPSPIAK